MFCSQCGSQLPADARFCSRCGAAVRSEIPMPTALADSSTDTPASAGDATGGIIPYKNLPALLGYYCGVFSLIPLLGLPLGIAAIPLGITGLRKQRRQPAVRGHVHAWVAVILGTLSTVLWTGLLAFFIVTLAND